MLTPRGASLVRWRVGDADVVLGFPDPSRYDAPHPYLGSIVGRFANRIAFARFALDGRAHALAPNDGAHHLHGGPDGFGRRLWRAERDGDSVRFRIESADGDQGYPGRLEAAVRYTLDCDDALRIDFRARCDRATVVSLASHAYWNLRDGGATSALDHELEIAADHYLPVDASLIPTGELRPVRGTPFDFTRPRRIAAEYDHCFALRGTGLRRVARPSDPASGRTLEVETTQPGLQLYTGNFLDGSLTGHGGARYGRHHGVCLETQAFPNAPNQPAFPSARLEPGAEYAHTTIYRVVSAGVPAR